MKKLFLICLVIGLSFPVLGQSGSASFFKSLSRTSSVHPTVRKASIGIYNNFTIRDSLLYYTQSFEKAVLQRRPAGNVKPELVRTALKKYPGNNYRTASYRVKLYASQGSKSRTRIRRR